MVRSGWSIGRLRPAELLILAGAATLITTMFFAWYELDLDSLTYRRVDGSPNIGSLELSFWDLAVARWFVLAALACAILLILCALIARTPGWAVVLGTPAVVFGFIATIFMVVRAIDSPADGYEATLAVYAALAGTVAVLLGAFGSLRDEYVPPGFAQAPEPERLTVER
ncbi:MAG TPA: hypothetical protein VGO97_04385 [Solirubrobacterales bacterium]|jgi:hypothetical protein|nr:hypothetical protein [Solirubrobacterales bacterium]